MNTATTQIAIESSAPAIPWPGAWDSAQSVPRTLKRPLRTVVLAVLAWALIVGLSSLSHREAAVNQVDTGQCTGHAE